RPPVATSTRQRRPALALPPAAASLSYPWGVNGPPTRGARHEPAAGPHQPPHPRDQPLPAAARPQPGGLVPLGARGPGIGPPPRPALLPQPGLLGLPLVPRHGARELRGPRDGPPPQRALRQHQGRPRGAPRPRPDLHDRGAAADPPGRLA